MSQQYDNRGRGVLFKNEDKTEERHPDYRGNITLPDGTECWLDAWIKSAKKDGRRFMSLSMKPKMAREHSAAPHPQQTRDADVDDKIPF